MSNEPKHTATPIGYILLRRIVVNEQVQNEDGSYEWKPMKSDFQKDYKTKRLYVSEKSALFAADQMLKIYPADEFKAIPVYKEPSDSESLRAENAELNALADKNDIEIEKLQSVQTDLVFENQVYRGKVEELESERAELIEALKGMVYIVQDSSGVYGYHKNGNIAYWDEFNEVDNALTTLAKYEKK